MPRRRQPLDPHGLAALRCRAAEPGGSPRPSTESRTVGPINLSARRISRSIIRCPDRVPSAKCGRNWSLWSCRRGHGIESAGESRPCRSVSSTRLPAVNRHFAPAEFPGSERAAVRSRLRFASAPAARPVDTAFLKHCKPACPRVETAPADTWDAGRERVKHDSVSHRAWLTGETTQSPRNLRGVARGLGRRARQSEATGWRIRRGDGQRRGREGDHLTPSIGPFPS